MFYGDDCAEETLLRFSANESASASLFGLAAKKSMDVDEIWDLSSASKVAMIEVLESGNVNFNMLVRCEWKDRAKGKGGFNKDRFCDMLAFKVVSQSEIDASRSAAGFPETPKKRGEAARRSSKRKRHPRSIGAAAAAVAAGGSDGDYDDSDSDE